MDFKPNLLLGKRHLLRLDELASLALARWSQHWAFSSVEVQAAQLIPIAAVEEDLQSAKSYRYCPDQADHWCYVSIQNEENLFSLLTTILPTYGPTTSKVVAPTGAITEKMLISLLDDLVRRLVYPDQHPSGIAFDNSNSDFACLYSNGLVKIDVHHQQQPLYTFYVGPYLTRHLTPIKDVDPHRVMPPLKSLNEAIQHQTIRLCLQLGTANLSLEDIQHIQVGDVIKLDNPISNQVLLGVADNFVTICATLGARQGQKAMKLLGK
ncbi:MAG: FliM/FliN family flagellar motor switch protein [Gammaproteobacteria bacterium]|nr:FliM/FliN family flagellar motor switch protein [Gammaproteobacteria bacterium]MDH5728575.1 FliM/FliN family flagellar motor switch protein [Gammaproteobacteria bacterium]